METHVKVLGILHIVFGAIGILIGLFVLAFFGGLAGLVGATEQSEGAFVAIPILGGIGGLVFVLLLAISLPGIIAGVGLLGFKPWARILSIVISGLELLNVPFGTALGIYGLWVLLSNRTEILFQRGGPPAPVRT
jgi:hypothetical protein